jgi:hypothetical protein
VYKITSYENMSVSNQYDQYTWKGSVAIFLGGIALIIGSVALVETLAGTAANTRVVAPVIVVIFWLYEANNRNSWLLGFGAVALGVQIITEFVAVSS